MSEHTLRFGVTVDRSHWRDRLAWRLCNLILRHVATPWYRQRIEFFQRRGLEALLEDVLPASPSFPPEETQ